MSSFDTGYLESIILKIFFARPIAMQLPRIRRPAIRHPDKANPSSTEIQSKGSRDLQLAAICFVHASFRPLPTIQRSARTFTD
jgi:hypothetical protein